MTISYVVDNENNHNTYKNILKNKLKISSRLLTKLKNMQKITVNNKICMINEQAVKGDIITINMDYEEDDDILAENNNQLKILYEDELFLAVEKPAHMVVHPTSLHQNGTLANYVKGYLNNKKKIRPINRLDNGTSGVILFGKNEYAQEIFKNLKPKPIKEYTAIVEGLLKIKEGTLELPIARKDSSIIERVVDFNNGQNAITNYKVINKFEIKGKKYSILKVLLDTGRTHQIRVHFSYIGHPLVGDTLYGKHCELIDRQALHASKLVFVHPLTKKIITIESQLPEDIRSFLENK